MTFLSIFLSLFLANDSTINTDSLPQKEIKEVVVYSIQSNKIGVPIVNVDKKEIETNDFITPADALNSQTGVSLMREGSWGTSVNVRGMNEQRLLFLVDGDRLLTATDVAGALSTVSLNQLEQIEVIKGSGSVIYGSGAVGGIVNFVSERPAYTEMLHSTGNIQAGYSSINKMTQTAGTVHITNKNWYLSLSGNIRKADDMQTPAGKLNNSQFNDASWAIKGGMLWGNNQELVVGYNEYKVWDAGIPGGNAFGKTALVRYKDVKRKQMSAEYIFNNLSPVVKKLSIKGYTQNITRDVENIASATQTILPSSFNATSGIRATSELYFNDYNTMTIGAESWYRQSETFRQKRVYGADTTIIADQPSPEASTLNTGVFALYKKVIDPKYFSMNFGGRLDFFITENDTLFKELYRYSIKNGNTTDRLYTNRIARILPSKKPEFAYAANIDLEYTPSTQHKLVLSMASSYRVATIEERYKYIDLGAQKPKIGNPDLKPEKGAMANLSYLFNGPKFRLRTDFFTNYLIDMIAETEGTFTNINGQQVAALVLKNINQAIYAGIELDANWLINKNISAFMNASYVRAQDATNGDFLLMIPPIHGIFGIEYQTAKHFAAKLSAQWALKQNEAASTEVKTPGHIILNLHLQSPEIHKKGIGLKLNAGIENILNEKYKNHLFGTRGLDYYEPERNIFAKLICNW